MKLLAPSVDHLPRDGTSTDDSHAGAGSAGVNPPDAPRQVRCHAPASLAHGAAHSATYFPRAGDVGWPLRLRSGCAAWRSLGLLPVQARWPERSRKACVSLPTAGNSRGDLNADTRDHVAEGPSQRAGRNHNADVVTWTS